MIINKPITLYFEPLSLELKFKECLKLQVAIFRLGAQQAKGQKRAVKMDKTDPVKYTNPLQKVTFAKTLSLPTTLPFNSESQIYQSKQVDFEVALEIDGKKERLGKKINLREVLLGKGKNYKITQENPSITFIYRAQVKVEDQKANMDQRPAEAKKVTKFLRFQENTPSNTKQNIKSKNEQPQVKIQRVQKGRYKTVFFQPIQQQGKIVDSNSEQTKIKKYRSLQKESINQVQQKQSQKKVTSQGSFQLNLKIKELNSKYQQLEQSLAKQQNYSQQIEKKLKEREEKTKQITHKAQLMEQKLLNQIKIQKKEKEDLRKQLGKTNQQNQIISQLRQQIKSYQQQVQKLRKTAINYQESTKHIASGSQQEIRALKQRINSLQRQKAEMSKQSQMYEQSLKSKDEIISDLRTKIYAIDKENLQLQNKIASLESKLNKAKEDYQFEKEELQNKIEDMKQQNKNFKIATLKDIKDEPNVDYKKKIQNLQRQLEKKQELLRKMTQMKKQNENERNLQINNLKKQLASVKEINQKLQSSKNTNAKQCSDIQIKIQLQKLKKELDTSRKNEKALLIEKGKLQTNNRALQDDIVKNKCAIANILNAVQETGNEKLITEVYTLTE